MVNNKKSISSKPVIEIKEMHKWFGNFHVLKNITLKVNQGERIVICGPSGSGKSTLIRCINRFFKSPVSSISFTIISPC